jgi:hypothetical protein
MLLPGTVAPALRCETLAHGPFDLARDAPPGGTYVFFHRGRHCKWTRLALKDLDDRIGDFAIRGVRIVAVSADGRDAASRLREQMQLIRLPLGHSLDPSTVAGDWGLYLTQNSTEAEAPPLHWEPAQVWVRADNTIGALSVQSAPNLWPDISQALRGIENTTNKYPERGSALPEPGRTARNAV